MNASYRKANVISLADGHSLTHLMELFPGGIEFRHIVWMMNRALNAVGFAHDAGVVPGAVIPEHLMYSESHGLTLVDWCYSVTAESKRHLPARVKARLD